MTDWRYWVTLEVRGGVTADTETEAGDLARDDAYEVIAAGIITRITDQVVLERESDE